MKATAGRVEGEIDFRSQIVRLWNGQVDDRPIMAAPLPFACPYLGAKIASAPFQTACGVFSLAPQFDS
jgi:hypothetical protein